MIKNVLAQTIKDHRLDRGLSQEKLAAQAGISWRYYQEIEAAEKLPSIQILFQLAHAMDMDYTALIAPAWKHWTPELIDDQ